MSNKTEKGLAYDAGYTAFTNEPVERRTVDACPFSAVDNPEERQEWLSGFSDALEAQHDVADLRKALKEARNDA